MELAPDFVMGLRVNRRPGSYGEAEMRDPGHIVYWLSRAGDWNERRAKANEAARNS